MGNLFKFIKLSKLQLITVTLVAEVVLFSDQISGAIIKEGDVTFKYG